MPSKGTKYTAEIARLKQQGLKDSQIAERLSVSKSVVVRNLHEARTRQRLGKLATQAGLHALKQVLVSCEIGWRWVEAERLKLLEGTSTLTAENLGTILRSQEKALDMARILLGKSFRPEELARRQENTDDPAMKTALEALRAQGVSI